MEEGRGMDSRPLVQAPASSLWMVVTSTAVAVAGSFQFGISVGFSSPAQSGIMHDLDLSLPQYSVFGSILTIGAMIGAIMSGRIADVIGRRYTMAVSDAFCIAGWSAIFLTKDLWWLDLGRLSVGFGIGLFSYVVPVYIAEITPKDLRGGFTSVNQLMICCGASLTYFLGTIMTWRTLAKLGASPCLLQLVGLLIIPESPRWLRHITGCTGSTTCRLLLSSEESTDRLLIRCSWMWWLWDHFEASFGINSHPDLLWAAWSSWRSTRVRSQLQGARDLCLMALYWCTWKERNNRVFRSKEKTTASTRREVFALISFWKKSLAGKEGCAFFKL